MKLEFYEQKGNYNLMDSSDYETQWYVTLKNDDGSVVEVDGKRCRLFWSEEGDQRGKYSMEDGLEYLAELSFKYGCKVWGSTDYKGQTLAFIQKYNEHREEIAPKYEAKRKKEIECEIEYLQRKLSQTVLDGNYSIDVDDITHSEQKKLKSWISSSEEKLSQYKDGTPAYNEELARIEKYKNELATYEELTTTKTDKQL